MELSIEGNDQYSFLVRGNTQPYKEIFKQHGGQWRPPLKAWRFTNSKITEVTGLVNGINSGQQVHATPVKAPVPAPSTYPVITPLVPTLNQVPLPFTSIPIENMQPKQHPVNEKNYVVEYVVPKIEAKQLLKIVHNEQPTNAIVTEKNDMILTLEIVNNTVDNTVEKEKIYATIINGKWKTFNPNDLGDVIIL